MSTHKTYVIAIDVNIDALERRYITKMQTNYQNNVTINNTFCPNWIRMPVYHFANAGGCATQIGRDLEEGEITPKTVSTCMYSVTT